MNKVFKKKSTDAPFQTKHILYKNLSVYTGMFQGTTVSDGSCHGPKTQTKWQKTDEKAPPMTFAQGKDFIEKVVSKIQLPSYMTEEALALFEMVYNDVVKRKKESWRVGVCLACVYIQVRKHKFGIPMLKLCSLSEHRSSLKECGRALKMLKVKYNVHIEPLYMHDKVDAYLTSLGLDQHVVPKAKEMLQFIKNLDIVQNKNVEHVTNIASYFAWRSFVVNSETPFCFGIFCSKHNIKRTQELGRVYTAVRRSFKSLVQELPWVKSTKKKLHCRNFEDYIDDILKYKSFLTQKVKELEEHKEHEPQAAASQVRDEGVTRETSLKRKREWEETNSDSDDLDLGSDDDTDQYIFSEKEIKERSLVLSKYPNI